MKLHFATLFDKNYLSRGLALYQSMVEHIADFNLYVLALDIEVKQYFEKAALPNIQVISLNQLEDFYPELKIASENRSRVEYYFTLSPVLPLYILEKNKDLDFITSLDADIYFFNSPKTLFEKFGDYSIMITAHNFSKELKHLEKYGKYNVSFQSFRNNQTGLTCLKKWKDQCLNWCFDFLEDEKFADQKYLDSWTKDYSGVLELNDATAGIAPWNVNNAIIKNENGCFTSAGKPLVFYHFHGLRYVNENIIKLGLNAYQANFYKGLKKLYSQYIFKLSTINKQLGTTDFSVLRNQVNAPIKNNLRLVSKGQAVYNLANNVLIEVNNRFIQVFATKIIDVLFSINRRWRTS